MCEKPTYDELVQRVRELKAEVDACRESNKALRESENKYRLIVDTAYEGIAIEAPDGSFTFVNQRMADMLGYPIEEILGKLITDFIYDGWEPEVNQVCKKAEKGSSIQGELKFRRKDGNAMWSAFNTSAVYDDAGRHIANIGMHTDITVRKGIEKRLIQSEKAFRAFVTASADVVYWMSPDWTEMRYLDGQDFILDTDHPSNTWLEKYIHPNDVPEVLKVINEAIRTTGIFELEHRVVRVDGTLGWTFSRAVPLLDEKGNIIEWIGAAKDITAQKQADETLKNLNTKLELRKKQLQTLVLELAVVEQNERQRLAEILHDELQQLLAVSKMNCVFLADQIKTEHRETIERIINLVNQSIQVSRNLTTELSPVGLKQGRLSAAIEWLASWMRDNQGLRVDLQLNPDLDPEREDITILMFHSIRELLYNVVKHSGAKWAQVSMVQNEKNELRVTVLDEGSGFDPLIVRDRSQANNGFGLFIIHERMKLLGGILKVESKPGKGASLTLIVPNEIAKEKRRQKRSARKVIEPSLSKPPKEKIRILLADDHALFRQGLLTILNLHPDIEVIGEAADGEAVVRMAKELNPNLIIMDISMPKMDGITATRIIRAQCPDMRIIGLSVHGEADQAVEMVNAGASEYFTKDGDIGILLAAIRGETKRPWLQTL